MMMRYLDEAVEACENLLVRSEPETDSTSEPASSKQFSADQTPEQTWTQACQTVGNILTGMGFVEESYPWRSMALDAEPNTIRFYAESGRVYSQCEAWDKAVYFCQRGLEYQPDNVKMRRLLAKVYNQMGNYRQESQTLNELLTLQPETATAEGHHQLGQIMVKQGQLQAAEQCYQRSIEQDNQYVAAYYALCELWAQQQRWKEAVSLIEQLIKRLSTAQPPAELSTQAMAHYRLGRVYRQSEQLNEAVSQFRQALQLDSHIHWAYMGLLNTLMQMKRWDEVIEPCQKLTHRAEEFPWIYTFMGNAFAGKEEWEAAATAHRQAFTLRGWTQCVEQEYVFGRTWFGEKIPVWEEHLADIFQPSAASWRGHIDNESSLQMLSLGSYDDVAICWLTDKVLHQPKDRLVCVTQQVSEPLADNAAKLSHPEKLVFEVGEPLQYLSQTMSQSESFAVILLQSNRKDANYLQSLVSQAWLRLKPGGVLLITDYQWHHPTDSSQSSQVGINAFIAAIGNSAKVLHHSHQIIVKKTTAQNTPTKTVLQEIPNA